MNRRLFRKLYNQKKIEKISKSIINQSSLINFDEMITQKETSPLIINVDILNSYSEFLNLVKKYRDKYIDKKINYDSYVDLKSLMLEYFNFKVVVYVIFYVI